jgi:hypothetical protein
MFWSFDLHQADLVIACMESDTEIECEGETSTTVLFSMQVTAI